MMRPLKSHRLSKRGAVMVEFAIVIMVVLTLMLGFFDFAWLIHHRNGMSFAAREGARALSLLNADEGEIRNRIDNILDGSRLNKEAIQVDLIDVPCTGGFPAAVEVRLSAPSSRLQLVGFLSLTGNVSESVQMTKECF